MNVGKSLKILQKRKRITNQMLADHMGVNNSQVVRWRNNEDMKASTLVAIAKYMEVSALELLQDRL
jgi:transcriptional regulator with XRE-family HTH domain